MSRDKPSYLNCEIDLYLMFITFTTDMGVRNVKQQQKFEPSRQQDLSTKSAIKNNNPAWHSLNKAISCKVCESYTGRHLVNHYVNFHPNDEVLTSRLAANVGEVLRNPNYHHLCKRVEPKAWISYFSQWCYFCNKSKCVRKDHWMEHMAVHSGCYRYNCTNCSKKFARISYHDVHKDKCNVEMVSQYEFEGVNLMAYVCELCNYVRFDKQEMEKHLRYEHDGDASNRYKKVIFLSFPEKKCEEVSEKMLNEEKIPKTSTGKLIRYTFISYITN